jgi:hypothetical protein
MRSLFDIKAGINEIARSLVSIGQRYGILSGKKREGRGPASPRLTDARIRGFVREVVLKTVPNRVKLYASLPAWFLNIA